jgi:hypothetical protein
MERMDPLMNKPGVFERLNFFPERRFDLDFPVVYWFAGLWFYLKGFLYLCFLYMLGSDPGPYETSIIFEVIYFSLAFIPSLILGFGFWNEKTWVIGPSLVFLLVDSPVLLFRVLRLADAGFLDSGLTQIFEFGGLVLNLITLVWLFAYRSAKQIKQSSSRK